MNIELGSTVRKVSAQASRVTRGEALVVLIEQRKLHRLNPVGTRVWELCDGRVVSSIVATIVAEFAVEADVAERDVCEFLETMQGLGALTVEASPSGVSDASAKGVA
jgi:hypothetical protein